MNYQLIIFDFDGTLCNTKSTVIDSVKSSYHQLGYVLPSLEKIQNGLKQGSTSKDTLKYISSDVEESKIDALLQAYQQNYIEQAKKQAVLFSGVVTVLQKLQNHNIQSIIVSNQIPGGLECLIEQFNLKQYIATFIGGEPGKFCKPNPRLYTHYLAPQFPHVSLKNILMVGDTSTDLEFAKAVGIDACWATYGDGNQTNCRALQPKYRIGQFSDLDNIIFST